MNKKIYLALTVYNYDASPRWERVKYTVKSEERAFTVARRLLALIGRADACQGRTRRWLEQRFRIDGFVERVDGIFVEETRRIG